mmetsp:Transcript_19682/g.54035  ORF Transcript_19682/g.54035 Transcript_19682/m.54035 type:complete len:275 (+) Transcript_19682:55-879(+)
MVKLRAGRLDRFQERLRCARDLIPPKREVVSNTSATLQSRSKTSTDRDCCSANHCRACCGNSEAELMWSEAWPSASLVLLDQTVLTCASAHPKDVVSIGGRRQKANRLQCIGRWLGRLRHILAAIGLLRLSHYCLRPFRIRRLQRLCRLRGLLRLAVLCSTRCARLGRGLHHDSLIRLLHRVLLPRVAPSNAFLRLRVSLASLLDARRPLLLRCLHHHLLLPFRLRVPLFLQGAEHSCCPDTCGYDRRKLQGEDEAVTRGVAVGYRRRSWLSGV